MKFKVQNNIGICEILCKQDKMMCDYVSDFNPK